MARKFIGTGTYDYPEILNPLLRGQLQGLGLSRDGGAPTTDIAIAAGACRDSTNVATLSTTGWVKEIDNTWAAGNGAGGMNDAEAVAQDTSYHVHILGKPDGTTEAGFDTSVTATNLLADAAVVAAGYTLYRRIGNVRTLDAAATIVPFFQHGDLFMWSDPNPTTFAALDFSTVGLTAGTPETATLNVPLGVRVEALINVIAFDSGTYYIYPGDGTDMAVGELVDSTYPMGQLNHDGNDDNIGLRILTNTSGQIKIDVDSGANKDVNISTMGWIDIRGKDV